jgi:hypothetical protein
VERWRPIIAAHEAELRLVIAHLLKTFPAPPLWARRCASAPLQLLPGFYAMDELRALSHLIGMPLLDVLGVQLAYEMMIACTAVVTHEGEHHRSLDWPLPRMDRLMIELNVMRGGKLVCRALTVPGYCGFLTGLVPGSFSVAVNHRIGTDSPVRVALRYMRGKAWPVGFALRDALLTQTTYAGARQHLAALPMVCPCYVTLCGRPGEGCLLVRSPEETVERVDVAQDAPIVITNHDAEELEAEGAEEDEGLMDSEDRKRVAEVAAGTAGGAAARAARLRRVFSRPPIYNMMTAMNCVMQPATGDLQWRVRGQRHLGSGASS